MLNNLINFNNLEFDFLSYPEHNWHINCSLLEARNLRMNDTEKRVLIIDPDTRERRGLTNYLKNENYDVETGKSLSEAIKKISQGCFICLIMDVDLPEMKGYEAVSIIKNLDPQIKVIMTTKKNTKRLEAKVREQDIFFYFIKSFGKEELKLAINNAFSK